MREYLSRKLRNSSSDALEGARPSLRFSEELFELLETVLRRLIAKGYVDDQRFAEYYVENRFVKKGVSRKRLAMELTKKGVAREIIDEVLDGRNDEAEILKMIAKKRAKYDDEKLIAYLCRQGFAYDLAKRCVKGYRDEDLAEWSGLAGLVDSIGAKSCSVLRKGLTKLGIKSSVAAFCLRVFSSSLTIIL